jgi:hypothetical protein
MGTEATRDEPSRGGRGSGAGAEVLSILGAGAGVVLVAYLVFRPPSWVSQVVAGGGAVTVAWIILCAALVAYGCRRVVQALLRLCGFR